MKQRVLSLLFFAFTNIHCYSALFLFFTSDLLGQKIEIFGAGNRNSFYDYPKYGTHFNGEYNSDYGYSFGISLDGIAIDSFPLKFTLGLNNYRGKIRISNGGLGGGSTTNAEINKYCIGLGIFPVNCKLIFKKMQLNIGGEFSFLMDETTTGYKYFWIMGNNSVIKLGNGSLQINKKIYFGIISRIAYEVNIKKDWFIIPNYFFYLGMTDEFQNIEAKTKSFRHYIGLGIKKTIK